MTIKWRLGVVAVQLCVLTLTTWWVTGAPVSATNWFLGGLLAIVISPQLWEPFFPKPADTIGNGIIFLFIYATAKHTLTKPVWDAAAFTILTAILLAITAVLLGRQAGAVRVARVARLVSQVATAKLIYSIVFVLSAVEWKPLIDLTLWRILGAWVVILLIGAINWQAVWSAATGGAAPCRIEGNIGPSTLLVSAPEIPHAGSFVTLASASFETDGVVLNRIRRADDAWAEIHILKPSDWHELISRPPVKLSICKQPKEGFVGSVDAGSTERTLRFVSTKRLEVSQVVGVFAPDNPIPVIYQIVGAKVERTEVKGGAHLIVRAEALQLGIFDTQTLRFIRDRWVPTPGASVFEVPESVLQPGVAAPEDWLLLGHVIGTKVPVYLDLNAACEGHLAVLGMTKMGKDEPRISSRRCARETPVGYHLGSDWGIREPASTVRCQYGDRI